MNYLEKSFNEWKSKQPVLSLEEAYKAGADEMLDCIQKTVVSVMINPQDTLMILSQIRENLNCEVFKCGNGITYIADKNLRGSEMYAVPYVNLFDICGVEKDE